MEQETKDMTVEENTDFVPQSGEEHDGKAKSKEKKQKKEKEQKDKKQKKPASPESGTKAILIAIIAVGVCLLCVSVVGIVGTATRMNRPQTADGTTAAQAVSADENDAGTPQQDVNAAVDAAPTAAQTQASNENQPQQNANAAVPQTDAEWLALFNNAVNQLKTDGPSFTKSKQTKTEDIQLSNKLAQSYVSVAKDKFLSDETVKTDIAKGDTASAVNAVSPDGASYVSALAVSDIQSLTHTTNADGNFVVRVTMADAVNPEPSGAFGKIFEFMTVDDVMNVYAPDMGATVESANVSVAFSDCYAEAVIAPSGKLVSYQTYVYAHMILKEAKISVVTTDLDATLVSNTSYDNIVW